MYFLHFESMICISKNRFKNPYFSVSAQNRFCSMGFGGPGVRTLRTCPLKTFFCLPQGRRNMIHPPALVDVFNINRFMCFSCVFPRREALICVAQYNLVKGGFWRPFQNTLHCPKTKYLYFDGSKSWGMKSGRFLSTFALYFSHFFNRLQFTFYIII